MESNYNIGYGKPPKGSQFKPGQCGNFKGRPKGIKRTDLDDMLEKELQSLIPLTNGGKITKEMAIIKQICNKAANGDYKSGKLILNVKAKQQQNALGRSFLEKLIRDGYLTESNARDYVATSRLLTLNTLPNAVYNLHREYYVKKTMAYEAAKDMLFLSGIWDASLPIKRFSDILRDLSSEYYFWEGVDASLGCIDPDETEKERILSELEANREYARPSKELYFSALDILFYLNANYLGYIVGFRDALMSLPGYKEEEEEILADKTEKELLSAAANEMTKEQYEVFKEELPKHKEYYNRFYAVQNPFETKEYLRIEKNIRSIIRSVVRWHVNGPEYRFFEDNDINQKKEVEICPADQQKPADM